MLDRSVHGGGSVRKKKPDDQHTAKGQHRETRSSPAALQHTRRGKGRNHVCAVRFDLVVVSTHRRNFPLVSYEGCYQRFIWQLLDGIAQKHSVAVTKREIRMFARRANRIRRKGESGSFWRACTARSAKTCWRRLQRARRVLAPFVLRACCARRRTVNGPAPTEALRPTRVGSGLARSFFVKATAIASP